MKDSWWEEEKDYMGSTGKVSTLYFTLGTAEPGLQQRPGLCMHSRPFSASEEDEGEGGTGSYPACVLVLLFSVSPLTQASPGVAVESRFLRHC